MILLKEQQMDISNKLKLFDVIVNIKFDVMHFGSHLITEIIGKTWPNAPPKNAFSLVKGFLKNHYTAPKSGKFLSVPEKCKGYKMIKVCIN